jgi:hypothetical protein
VVPGPDAQAVTHGTPYSPPKAKAAAAGNPSSPPDHMHQLGAPG